MKANFSAAIRVRLKKNRSLLRAILLALIVVFPIPTMAEVNVDVSISLPPPIVFGAPPEVIVLPETYVYVVPDVDEEIFFYDGWWWRPWEGRWYRSQYYDSGWVYYRRTPSFYAGIPSGWRSDYRDHRWGGQPWNYQRIPQQQVKQNWRHWEESRHWEKQQTWGVQGLKPRTRAQQLHRESQPKAQTRLDMSEAAGKRQARPQSGEVRPQYKQQQHRDAPQEVRPGSGRHEPSQAVQPRVQTKQKVRKAVKPQQTHPQEGKPGRGDEGKRDRN